MNFLHVLSARVFSRILLLATFLSVGVATFAEESVTVVSWGGSYAKACEKGYHIAFKEASGIKVKMEDYNGGLAQIRAQVESGKVHWDVIDLESQAELIGCDEGLFEPFDYSTLPPSPDGTSASEDLDAETHVECGVPSIYWSTILAYNKTHFPGEQPSSVEDFFDLETFPGRRGMRRTAIANMEWALMADGVPVEEIYEILGTKEGLERAFRKLDTIRDHVVWWEAGAQPPQLLADGEVLISTAYNGRIFNAQVSENQPIEIIWDGQIASVTYLAIVAGTPNLENALTFMKFAARAESQAGVGSYISYAPVRASGRAMVTTHAENRKVDMAPHLPSHPNNTKRRLLHSVEFWSDNVDEISERFSSWLAR